MIGIYKITNNINGKCYIGKSESNIEKRLNQHKQGKRSSRYLQNSIKKYGIENFTFEILEECEQSKCCERERYWIQYYDSMNFGYNRTSGGERKSGFKLSLEARQKISKSNKGNPNRCGINASGYGKAYNKGKHLSEETKLKIKRVKELNGHGPNGWLGRKHTEETKKKLSQNHADVSGSNNGRYNVKLIYINNGKENKMIKPEELKLWESKGYTKGVLPVIRTNNGTKIIINNKHINKYIFPEELDLYLSQGYSVGKLK